MFIHLATDLTVPFIPRFHTHKHTNTLSHTLSHTHSSKGRRTEAVEEEALKERPASASVTMTTALEREREVMVPLGKPAVPLFQTNKEKERQQSADTLRERESEREVMVPCNIIPQLNHAMHS